MKQSRLVAAIRHFVACERANGIVELGLVSALLMASVFGLVEFAAVTGQSIKLSNAARAAVEYATGDPTDITGITNVAVRSGDLNSATLTVAVSQFCECPGVGSAGCGDVCSDGSPSSMYVTVSLTQPAESYIEGNSLLADVTLDRAATMRIR